MPKRRRSSFKKGSFPSSRSRRFKRRKIGRAASSFSFRGGTAAVPYHPWRNYRPKVARALSGYSDDSIIVKLTTSATWANNSIAIFTSLACQANSVSDPFGASGAVRPSGYTQYAALYNYYAVMGSAITVQYQAGNTATTANPIIFGVFPQAANNGLVTDYSDALSQSRCKYCIMDTNTATLSAPARKEDRVAMYFTTDQIMGQAPGYYMSQQNNAGVAADPSLLWYYTIWCDTVDSSSTYTIQVLITLTQYVRFWARKALADV